MVDNKKTFRVSQTLKVSANKQPITIPVPPRCNRCGRKLKSPRSIKRGMGYICAKKAEHETCAP